METCASRFVYNSWVQKGQTSKAKDDEELKREEKREQQTTPTTHEIFSLRRNIRHWDTFKTWINPTSCAMQIQEEAEWVVQEIGWAKYFIGCVSYYFVVYTNGTQFRMERDLSEYDCLGEKINNSWLIFIHRHDMVLGYFVTDKFSYHISR